MAGAHRLLSGPLFGLNSDGMLFLPAVELNSMGSEAQKVFFVLFFFRQSPPHLSHSHLTSLRFVAPLSHPCRRTATPRLRPPSNTNEARERRKGSRVKLQQGERRERLAEAGLSAHHVLSSSTA